MIMIAWTRLYMVEPEARVCVKLHEYEYNFVIQDEQSMYLQRLRCRNIFGMHDGYVKVCLCVVL